MTEQLDWLEGARGAPSAHNTQPWRFAPLPTGEALVRWHPGRTLPKSDPTGRDLYLSLGTAVEGAILRSAAAGKGLAFEPAEAGDDRAVGLLRPVDRAPEVADRRLAAFLGVRQTGRVSHLAGQLPEGIAASLVAEAATFGCHLHLLQQRGAIHSLAVLARRATAAQFAHPDVNRELWQWLRLDPQDPAYRCDGLTAECLNLHGPALTIARLTLPPRRMRWLAHVGFHHVLAYDTQRVVRASTALCLLTCPSTTRTDLVQAGRLLLRLWLIAAGAGLTTHPISALLDCSFTVAPVTRLFGCADSAPVSIFRLGACPPVPRSPRLPLRELLEAAR